MRVNTPEKDTRGEPTYLIAFPGYDFDNPKDYWTDSGQLDVRAYDKGREFAMADAAPKDNPYDGNDGLRGLILSDSWRYGYNEINYPIARRPLAF